MQSLAGIRRLGRSCRRWRLLRFQLDLRGGWSSVCPALLCNPRRNQVAPMIGAVETILYPTQAFSMALPGSSWLRRSPRLTTGTGSGHWLLAMVGLKPAPVLSRGAMIKRLWRQIINSGSRRAAEHLKIAGDTDTNLIVAMGLWQGVAIGSARGRCAVDPSATAHDAFLAFRSDAR